MAHQQEENNDKTSIAQRALRTESAIASEVGTGTAVAPGPISAPGAAAMHLSMGNSVIHAALAGEVGPMGSLIAGSLLAEATGMGAESFGSNTAAMRSMASEGLQPSKTDISTLRTGGGAKIGDRNKRRMERAFGKDFSHVRTHSDAGAAHAAQSLNALAATLDSHIFFGAGKNAPGTKGGDRLLAHELTHVVQSMENRLPKASKGLEVSSPNDRAEQEAYANEGRILGMLPMIDKMFQAESEAARKLGQSPQALLEALEESSGGELPMPVAIRLLRMLGNSSEADDKTLSSIETMGGSGAADFATSLLDAPAAEASTSAGAEVESPVVEGSAAVQVARHADGSELVKGAMMGNTKLDTVATLRGGGLDSLNEALNSGHGNMVEESIGTEVHQAMQAAMGSPSNWESYDPSAPRQAGQDKLSEKINATPQNSKVATAVEMAKRGGSRTTLPYKQEILQWLVKLGIIPSSDEGEFDQAYLNNIQVVTCAPACEALGAAAFVAGNLLVLKSAALPIAIVKEEVIHVIQQGGIHVNTANTDTPANMTMTSPTDSVETQAVGIAGGSQSAAGLNPGGSGVQVARAIDLGVTQPEVFNAVLENSIPDGFSENISTFTDEAAAIQGGTDAVLGVVNAASSFPLDKVESLFEGDALDVFETNSFFESLKNSEDNMVQEVVGTVMGICDTALSILDGVIGVITEIMNVVESFCQLLESLANALLVFGAILIGIGTGLIFVIIPSGIGSQFVQWGNDLLNLGNKINNIKDNVMKILEPLQEVIEKIEKVKEMIEKIRTICETIQQAMDVYEWFSQDTADERDGASLDLHDAIDRSGELLGQLTGGEYNFFATKFWEDSRPVIDYMLEGQTELTPVNDQTTPSPLGIAVPGVTPAGPATPDDPSGIDAAFAQKKGERTGEGADVFKKIVEPISWPSFFKPKPSDGIKVVLKLVGPSQGDSGDPGKDGHVHPGETQGGPAGSGSSIVSGDFGEVGGMSQTSMDLSQYTADVFEPTQHVLDLLGYPSNIAEVLDYVNNLIVTQETSANKETQSYQRMQESEMLIENATNSITAASNIIQLSADQDSAAKADENEAHEGVGFMDYLIGLSQGLQGDLQTKIQEMMQAQLESTIATALGMESESNADGLVKQAQQLGMSGGGIASMLAGFLIQMILQQIIPQLGIGEILKNMLPEDLGSVIELATSFIDTATGAKERAIKKQQESESSKAVLQKVIAKDKESQQQAKKQKADAEKMKSTAEATLAKGQESLSKAEQLRQQSQQLDANLKTEQTRVEASMQSNLDSAGPMRPRVQPQYVDPVTGWENLSLPTYSGKAPDSPIGPQPTLPVSSDMGFPDPVAGPIETQLIPSSPLPGVVSPQDLHEMEGYRDFTVPMAVPYEARTDAPLQLADTFNQASVPSPGDPSVSVDMQGYDAGYKAPAPETDELVMVRELTKDLEMTVTGIEVRSQDPAPPIPAAIQQFEIDSPTNNLATEQEKLRYEQITKAHADIPSFTHMYNTLKPLPEIAKPQSEFASLAPMETAALGYNDQQILIDADVSSVQGWAGTLPGDAKMLDPGQGGGMTMPTLVQPNVPTATSATIAEYPTLKLNIVAPVSTPTIPASVVRLDNPDAVSRNSDVFDKELVQIKYGEVTGNVSGIHDDHKTREDGFLQGIQNQIIDAQKKQQDEMNAALQKRDADIRASRKTMESDQKTAVGALETDATAQEQAQFNAANSALDTGLSTADTEMRTGESQAIAFQAQASADAANTKAQTNEKALSLWGWFQEQVSRFTSAVAQTLSVLWNRANHAIEATLLGARASALGLLGMAEQTAVSALSALGNDVAGMYSDLRSKLTEIGTAGRESIQGAITAGIDAITSITTNAAEVVNGLMENATETVKGWAAESQEKVDAEWEDFDQFNEKIREADRQFPNDVAQRDNLLQPNNPDPTAVTPHQHNADATGSDSNGTSNGVPGPNHSIDGKGATPAARATTVSGRVTEFVTATPTIQAETWHTVGADVDALAKSEEATFQGGLDTVDAQLGGDLMGQMERVDRPTNRNLNGPSGGPRGDVEMKETAPVDRTPLNDAPQLDIEEIHPDIDVRPRESATAESIEGVQVVDANIDTNPGPVPAVPLRNETDPQQLTDAANEALQKLLADTREAQQAVLDSPGPEILKTKDLLEQMEVGELEDISIEASMPNAQMDEYTGFNLEGEVEAAYDSMWMGMMQGNLQPYQADFDSAIADRDASRDEAITGVHDDALQASIDAQLDQETEVKRQQDEITRERQETLDAQAEELSRQRGEAEKAYRTERGKINSRVRADQNKINAEFAKAQRAADKEVRDGEKKAEEEKLKAEREADNASWWEKAKGFVKNAISKLTDVVNSIFDAVRNAVNRILDAVKSLANTIIDAACSFIKGVIEAYGELLKAYIDVFIGTFLPGLAEDLKAAVDTVVDVTQQFVDDVAEGLKERVNELIDAFQNTLNDILDAAQTAFNTAMTIATAIIDGDWLEVLKMILEAALTAVGIDPGEFFALVGDAASILRQIISDPGTFVSNVIQAGRQGFEQFGSNFMDHMIAGFVDWATGKAGEAGFEMPGEWNAKTVTTIVIEQVMGITLDGLFEKVQERFGEQNQARLDFIWETLEPVVGNGIAGLYDLDAGVFDLIYDSLIDATIDWLLQRIVQSAVTRIIAMFTPVGALFNALSTAWDVYNWVKDNLNDIQSILAAFVGNFQDIVQGNIGPAANMVEGALADLIPLALDMLMRLFNLDNIVNMLRDKIEALHETVDQKIDAILDRIDGGFSPSQAEGHHDDAGTPNVEFTDEHGEDHEAWIEEDGSAHVASTPLEFTAAMSNMDLDWGYVSDSEKGTVRSSASTISSDHAAFAGGNTDAFANQDETLLTAVETFQTSILPADQYPDEEEVVADGKKDDGESAVAQESGESVANGEDANAQGPTVNADGGAGNEAPAAAAANPAAANALADFVTAAGPWFDQIGCRDLFGAGPALGEALPEHSEPQAAVQEATAPTRGEMLTDALVTGAGKGIVDGVKNAAIGFVTDKIGKRVPFVSGLVEVAEFVYDPGAWIEGVGQGIVGGGNFGKAGASFSSMMEAGMSFEGMVHAITGVLQVVDGINSVISTISKICWFIAGVGTIASLFFPALWPFVAMAAKWATVLSAVSAAIGVCTTALKALVLILQSLYILYGDASPEELAAAQELVTKQTADFVGGFAERATKKGIDAVEAKATTKFSGKDTAAGETDPVTSKAPKEEKPKEGFLESMRYVATGKKKTDKSGWEQLKTSVADVKSTAKVNKEVFGWDKTLEPWTKLTTGEKLEALDNAGITVYRNPEAARRINERLGPDGDPRFLAAQQDMETKQQEVIKSQEAAKAASEEVQVKAKAMEKAASKKAAAKTLDDQISGAEGNLKETQTFADEFVKLETAAKDVQRTADDAARQAEYLSAQDPANANLRQLATDKRKAATDAADALASTQADADAARTLVNDASAELTRYTKEARELEKEMKKKKAEMKAAENDEKKKKEISEELEKKAPKRPELWEMTPPGFKWKDGSKTEMEEKPGNGSALQKMIVDKLVNQIDPTEKARDAAYKELVPKAEEWGVKAWVNSKVSSFMPWVKEESPVTETATKEEEAQGDIELEGPQGEIQPVTASVVSTSDPSPDLQMQIVDLYTGMVGGNPEVNIDLPSLTDGRVSAITVVDSEMAAVDERLADFDVYAAIAEANVPEFDGIDKTVEGGHEGISAVDKVAQHKFAKQDELAKEGVKASKEAGSANKDGDKASSKIMTIVSPFLSMLNIIPERWRGRVSAGFEAINALKDVGEGIPKATEGLEEKATNAQSDAAAFKATSTEANNTVQATSGDIDGVSQQNAQLRSDNTAATGEIDTGKADAKAYLETLKGEKARLTQEHADHVAEAQGWVSEHESHVDGGQSSIEAIAAQIAAK